MNLLLLLSALLSALTGVGVGARRPEVAQSVAVQAITTTPARVAATTIASRPIAALPTLAAAAGFDVSAIPVLIGMTHLWASRRRE
ncbi:hypothetical protein [uncultured Sphingomonas sp.]|uniref:hypothetical protein n=1 Tax=uncultured Sphingomonas sp. TaxID=158754 RepID=UPI0035CBB040